MSDVGTNNLPAGYSLGHYKILKPIGAGGMGEVYLAEDESLGRRVAIKLLPALFTADADRLQRFKQEARAASALNHPNILTIHEVGTSDGDGFYIATEFIDGETLRRKLNRERLSIAEILEIAIQVASALASAHEARIIHRDIKPENIMLRRDNLVKVLDFGLAKLTDDRQPAIDAEAETRAQTAPGVILGTVQYMSPEQTRGKSIDERSDLWSLGCVLYEMISGQAAFSGETVADLIADIVKSNPAPLSQFDDSVPERLDEIVAKTLEKNPDERYQTAKDLLIDLRRLKRKVDLEAELERSHAPSTQEKKVSSNPDAERKTLIAATNTTENIETPGHTTSSAEYIVGEIKRHKIAMGVIGIVLLASAAGIAYWLVQGGVSGPQQQTARQTAPGNINIQRLTGNGKVSHAAISPDGKFLAYVQSEGTSMSLWVKQISTNSNVQVLAPAVIERFADLTFTPDGSYIYFNGHTAENPVRTIFRVPTLGGSVSKIISDAYGASFSPDGKQIVFGRWNAETTETSVFIANADGTGERKLASRGVKQYFTGAGAWSPDAKVIACGIGDDEQPNRQNGIAVIDVSDGAFRQIGTFMWDSIESLAWLPDMSGIVFSADDAGGGEGTYKLFEISYPGGESRRLTQDLTDYNRISMTADGKAIVAVQSDDTSSLWVSQNADIGGATQLNTGKNSVVRGIAWTPDKRLVYISSDSGSTEVWIMGRDGSNPKQLTTDTRIKYTPVVSSDGRYIVYAASQGASLWRINIDGSGAMPLVPKDPDAGNPDISPDGKWVIYSAWVLGKLSIWRVSIDGGEPSQLTNFTSTEPHISPDGKLISCFSTDEKNLNYITVFPFEGGAAIKTFNIPQTVDIDMTPKWTPDGRGITYVDRRGGSRNLWLQPFAGGAPKQLTDFKQNGIYRREWTRDGKQVAIVRGESTNDVVMITDFK